MRGACELGEEGHMKFGKACVRLALVASATVLLCCGCGNSNGFIATTVSVVSSVGNTLILGQSTTITATVTGPTDVNVKWIGPSNTTACQYTTTTVSTSGTSTTSSRLPCPSDGSLGTLSNEQITGTATFTAPGVLPDPTKFPGLVIDIYACTEATPVKCALPLALTIDSGITVSLTPGTAAVPTSEKQPFFAVLTNDLKNQGVTWLLTQQTPTGTSTSTNTNAYAKLVTCTVSGNASGCGSIDTNGVYTAPSAVPTTTVPANTTAAPTDCTTPQNLTIVATSVTDPTRFAIGTVTVTQGGPITFNGVSPTIAPQGAAYWDIFLNAPNMSSSTLITLTDANNGTTQLNSGTGQVKVLFPIPVSTTTTTTTSNGCSITTATTPGSTGTRIRLLANNLATAGPVTVSITDPAQPVKQNPNGTFTYNVIPVRPTVSATSPNDIIQNTTAATQLNIPMTIDGGYFGNQGQLARATFAGVPLPGSTNGQGQPTSSSQQLDVQFPATSINSGLPGLYSLAVNSTASPLPSPNNPAVSNLAVFPSYATNPPVVVGYVNMPMGSNPSAIDIDPTLGVIAVVETSANAVQFYSIGTGALTPISTAAVGNLPTGLSINRTNHTVAVVNYGDQSVTVLPIPGAPTQAPGTPFTFSIAGVLQGAVNPAPLPYSIGVDPDTNFGVVAYSSTSASSASNLGFLVDLNPGDTTKCLAFSGGPTAPPCAFAQVTLNTGAYPQVAMAPHGHLAFVSPGGGGALAGIDVTKPSSFVGIQSLTLAAGVVTVNTTACNTSTLNPTQVLFPGNSGTVLIAGVPTTNAAGNTNFNGVYTASAVSDTSFTYIVNSTASGTVTIPNVTLNCPSTPSSTPVPPAPSSANVFFSRPNLLYGGVSPTAQGIAINPISNTAALVDPNATGSAGAEINVINNLDQSVSDISYFATCTFYTTSCSNGPELLGAANIAWQPYSNAIVSYNSNLNQVSVSDPTSSRRYALACEVDTPTNNKSSAGTACIVDPSSNPLPPVCNLSASTCAQLFQNQITLQGTGQATLKVNNGTTGSLTLWGGLAVDAATNQAFVVMSGSNQIDIINLGPCSPATDFDSFPVQPCINPFNNLKAAQISDILVPNPQPGFGVVGGIPNASVPNGALTSATDLAGVQIFGSGFDAATQVRLDGAPIPPSDITFVNSRQLTVTIPASFLSFPHDYALDVINGGGSQSNPTDFYVIQAVDLSTICPPAIAQPSSVAIADQIANGPFQPIAVVSNIGCNNIVTVDLNPADVVGGTGPNPGRFGTLIGSAAVGAGPQGVAVSQPLGLAVTANNAAGTASIVNLLTSSLAVPDVSTGTNPTGVAINDQTGAAIITNTGANTISEINLSLLFGSSPATKLNPVSIGGLQEPTAIAIDPDRGTNNQGIAVVTSLQLVSGQAPSGALQVVDIGLGSPALSTTISAGTVTAPSTGIVFDPAVATGTTNPGVFFASSAGGNVITSFNPDNSAQSSANVGINPTSLAVNPQTGTIVTTNVAGKTTSFVDVTSSPLKTVQTLGLPGSPQFGVAIDPFTNLAVIVDQANNRLFILPASR
jgi:hypothetical protein